MILINLQKALVNHNKSRNLLKKLWFWSYLCERILFIEIENQLSDYGKILCGVPQGSILGRLMFLIYVNDMPQVVKSNLFLYVDDSCLKYQ